MIRAVLLLLVLGLLIPQAFFATPTHADSIDDIKAQIEAINEERAKIDKEIAGYQAQLNSIGAEKQTLQSAIQTLDVSRSATQSQIASIRKKISSANLRLEQLSFEISDKESLIALDRATLAQSLRTLQSAGDITLIEQLFSSDDLADAWTAADNLTSLNEALHTHARALAEVKAALADQQDAVKDTKVDLSRSNTDLESQKKALDINRQGKQDLLSQTQSQESAYQALVAQKRAQQKAFEAQLFAFESQLKQALDPSSIPAAGAGVLAYPVDAPYVTQYFGSTVDAKRLYVSGSHGGVDFRAPIGTPIRAALTGVVTDTEAVKYKSGCQYGKFALIKHANGLSTIYGHLSTVSVRPGDTVTTGDVIGYSGDTGYATGPHLHFGVYATQGIQIVTSETINPSTGCVGIKTVAARPEVYLDPMLYF